MKNDDTDLRKRQVMEREAALRQRVLSLEAEARRYGIRPQEPR